MEGLVVVVVVGGGGRGRRRGGCENIRREEGVIEEVDEASHGQFLRLE